MTDPASPVDGDRRPSPEALRKALAEVATRGKFSDLSEFARDLRIDLDDRRRGVRAALSAGRGRAIERAALGIFAGLCIAAAFVLAADRRTIAPDVVIGPKAIALAEAEGDFSTRGLASPLAPPPAVRIQTMRADHLDHRELTVLLEAKPVKCVAPASGRQSSALGLNLPVVLASAPSSACAEEVRYDVAHGSFTLRAWLASGVLLEINGAFAVENGAICHRIGGMTAHTFSDDAAAAKRYGELADRAIETAKGAKLCHRYRPADKSKPGGYVADHLGAAGATKLAQAPAPFEMRRLR
ncbi:MAG: hypothetical protein MRY74_15780 [Neomegalonema sp.]|nr:hypothetical protein [Neomegalonema sp.]